MLIKSGRLSAQESRLSRRQVLRGAVGATSVAIQLPLLGYLLSESGTAMAATGQVLPLRFGTWFWGLGMNRRVFVPRVTGADFDFPEEISVLEPLRRHLNLFTGFSVPIDGNPNLCHYSGWVALRCGATPKSRGDLPGESLDNPIARAVGGGTPFRMINLAATGNPRDSYSFRDSDSVNPPEISAVDLYQKLFTTGLGSSDGSTTDSKTLLRRSVLSGVMDDARSLSRSVGAEDRARLDQFLTSIRELENRLELQLAPAEVPASCPKAPEQPEGVGVGLDYRLVESRHTAMADLLVLALACNKTRVFNMLYSNSASLITRQGLDSVHHNITHEELFDPKQGIQVQSSWFLREAFKSFAYFVAALAKQPEGAGSLIDNVLVYAHSDNEDAKTHVLNGTPMFTVGKAGGRLRTGLHVDGRGDVATRLGYTVQRVMGLPVAEWGSGSLQTSREITEILA